MTEHSFAERSEGLCVLFFMFLFIYSLYHFLCQKSIKNYKKRCRRMTKTAWDAMRPTLLCVPLQCFALKGFGGVGVERLVGEVARQIFIIALRTNHRGIVSAKAQRRHTQSNLTFCTLAL